MNFLCFEPESDFVFASPWFAPALPEGRRNVVFRARRSFTLETVPDEMRLFIAAESYYRLWINGVEVGAGPVRGTWSLSYFDIYRIDSLLRPGVNTVECLVGWQGRSNFINAPAAPALRLEIPGAVAELDGWEVAFAADYFPTEQPYTKQTGFMEFRDLRRKGAEAWERPVNVADAGLAGRRVLPRDVPALTVTRVLPVDIAMLRAVPPGVEEDPSRFADVINREMYLPLPPERLEQPAALSDPGAREAFTLLPAADGAGAALVLDFGRDLIGFLELEVEAPAGTVVDVTYGEEKWNDRVRADFQGNEYYFSDRYILGGGLNRLGTEVAERGFRMVQLVFRDFAEPVRIRRAAAADRRYPYVRRGDFFSSDFELNRIHDVCVKTLEACTTDIFLDCPWRERAFWVNDMIVENRTTLAAFGASAVHRRAFELAYSQQRPDGMIPGVCPAPPDGELILVPTCLFIIQMLRDYYLASGDGATVAKFLGNAEKTLDGFEAWCDAAGLPRPPEGVWNFYDWSFELNGYSFGNQRESMLASLYVTGMKTFLELASEVGYAPKRGDYPARIERTGKAVIAEFYDPALQRLVDPVRLHDRPGATLSSQLSHAFALQAGIVPPELEKTFARAVADPELLLPEFYLHRFIFNALVDSGQAAEALRRIRKYWGRAVETGYSTLYESGIHEFGRESFFDCGSLCHGFGTSPLEFFQRAILGVTPVKAGFAEFRLEPQAFDLAFARGRIPTPGGNIRVSWRKLRDALEVDFEVPPGCTAVLRTGRRYPAGSYRVRLLEI